MTPIANPIEEVFVLPASFAQQRLWYVNQLTGATATYNISQARRLRGTLQIAALNAAIQTIIQRHETLRTRFELIDQAPVQIIAATAAIEIPVIDLSQQPEAEKWPAAIALVNQVIQQPFNLNQLPLLRLTLLRLSADEHILVIVFHHIIADAWSLGVFWRELTLCYQAWSQGEPPHLEDLPIQYADYTLWQQQQFEQQGWDTDRHYWKQQLSGPLPILQLPQSRPRPSIQTFVGNTVSQRFSCALTTDLKSLSQTLQCTLYMTLLAAFQILLYRYSGQEDVIVGTPIAGRTQTELEGLIGYFVNTLAIRADLSGNPSFRQFIERVRDVTLAAYEHADLPFEKLIEELSPPRDVSRSPLFQVMFVLQNAPSAPPQLNDLEILPVALEQGTAKFDLTLSLRERSKELVANLEYNTDLFDAAMVDRMLQHYQQLLEGIVANPDQPIAELPLITPAERQQQWVEWNQTSTDYPRDRGIHQIFAAQVEQSPHAIAVSYEQQSLTYIELNHRANQLAYHLKQLGVHSETRVGICLERSQLLNLVVSMLGILKVGAAYVPLDPSYPAERIAFIVQDADVAVLLTQAHHLATLPPSIADVICLDRDGPTITTQPNVNCDMASINPEQLAYVMYTSGSTGHPKGVAVPHRAVNRLVCRTNYVQLQPRDRIAQAANITFDAATFEIWGALLNGGTVVGLAPETLLSPQQFANFLHQAQISTLFLTTALFHQLARVVPQAFATLRYLLVGGEAIEPHWAKQVVSHGKPQHFLNAYGPTENTTFASYYEIETVLENQTTIPIGQPIANTTLYVLDRSLQPVPIGVPGELYLGGDGLAQGYLNRPDLTAERFIAHPDLSGDRLYKTGDLVRYLADGNIEYLGRQDHQIKLRGFRIELGEIEASLHQHPAVQAAIVLAHPQLSEGLQLVAYVIPQLHTNPTIIELRQFLQTKLPEYMVPQTFSLLASFPLTANGKVDRQALGSLPSTTLPTASAITEPRNPIELQLLEIWKELLVNRAIGVTDNFFEVGGHSLLAIRLFTQVEKIFSQSLPLNLIYQAPTVEQLAAVIKQEYYTIDQSPIVEFQKGGDRPPLICFPGVFGTFFYCYGLARYMDAEQPIYALREPGRYGEKVVFSTIEELAADYVQTIRALQPQGPYYLAGYSFGGLVMYEVAQQLQSQGEKIALLASLEATNPVLSPWLQWYFRYTPALLELRTLAYYLNIMGITGREKHRITWKMIFNPKSATDAYISQQGLSEEQQYLRDYLKTVVRSMELYRPMPYPGSMHLFLTAQRQQRPRFWQVWEKLAQKGVTCYPIAGNHRTLGDEPHVKALAQQLQIKIDLVSANKLK